MAYFFGENDSRFDIHKQSFIQALRQVEPSNPLISVIEVNTYKLPIVVAEDLRAVASCSIRGGRGVGISINKRYINSPNIEKIVWHELGHCILNMGHFDSLNDTMNTAIDVYNKEDRNLDFIYRFFR